MPVVEIAGDPHGLCTRCPYRKAEALSVRRGMSAQHAVAHVVFALIEQERLIHRLAP
jgi:hypothetical protein